MIKPKYLSTLIQLIDRIKLWVLSLKLLLVKLPEYNWRFFLPYALTVILIFERAVVVSKEGELKFPVAHQSIFINYCWDVSDKALVMWDSK